MIEKSIIKKNLNNTLKEAEFEELPNYYKGKVRENYDIGNKRILISTDRQSAFDVILAEVPFKGQVLNQTSMFWFEKTKDIVKNHLLESPDPNVAVVKKAKVFSIEFVIRAYLTGTTTTSSWWHYENNDRKICGIEMPAGMKKNEKFDKIISTPTTKNFSGGHDKPISRDEIIDQNIISKEKYDFIEKKSFELFKRGEKIANENGLILVDTKYEFGEDENGEIMLVDEIHTPDSSRFWIKDSYKKRISEDKEPESLDKEFLRIFLANKGFIGDGKVPEIPKEKIIEFSQKYIQLYEKVTGQNFILPKTDINVKARIKKNLKKYF